MLRGTFTLGWLIVCAFLVGTTNVGLGAAASAAQATPVAVEQAPSGFLGLLDRVPDPPAGSVPITGILAEYSDFAAQVAAVGVAVPASGDEEAVGRWIEATAPLASPSLLLDSALASDEWRATFGFDVFHLDQSLATGEAGERTFVLRGRFDAAELRAAWTQSGYRPVEVPGAEAYSFREDAEVDFSTDVGFLAAGDFNNAALLPDGTVIFASTLANLRAALAAADGSTPSLADRPRVAAVLAALPEPLVAGMLLTGDAVRGPDLAAEAAAGNLSEEAAAARATVEAQLIEALPPMPPIRLLALGVTAGGPLPSFLDTRPATPATGVPTARVLIAALMDDRTAVETAAPIVERRLAQADFPHVYRYFVADRTIAIASDDPVLVIDLALAEGVMPDEWLTRFEEEWFGFLAW